MPATNQIARNFQLTRTVIDARTNCWRLRRQFFSCAVLLLSLAALLATTGGSLAGDASVRERVMGREYPSIFQAWNPIDMPNDFPQDTLAGRLGAAAKHDVLWEEPVSQKGMGVKLVLGAEWAGSHAGTATEFTPASLASALANRHEMLRQNAHLVLLMEVRWRDAPNSFLPEDSPFWKRRDGKRVLGWDGGPEPYYLLDYGNPDFFNNIARQCKYAIRSGVYDGVMFDWGGYPPIVRQVRKTIGRAALIIVNIHDDIAKAREFGTDINGSFMECNPAQAGGLKLGTWPSVTAGLDYFDTHMRKPRLNCFEVWGDRKNLSLMRAATTLALTHSDASVLFADPDDLPTPDHLHDWYPFWDQKVGRPIARRIDRPDGACQREFKRATVLYNPPGNHPVIVTFDDLRTRASDGSAGRQFEVSGGDGDCFIKQNSSQ